MVPWPTPFGKPNPRLPHRPQPQSFRPERWALPDGSQGRHSVQESGLLHHPRDAAWCITTASGLTVELWLIDGRFAREGVHLIIAEGGKPQASVRLNGTAAGGEGGYKLRTASGHVVEIFTEGGRLSRAEGPALILRMPDGSGLDAYAERGVLLRQHIVDAPTPSPAPSLAPRPAISNKKGRQPRP